MIQGLFKIHPWTTTRFARVHEAHQKLSQVVFLSSASLGDRLSVTGDKASPRDTPSQCIVRSLSSSIDRPRGIPRQMTVLQRGAPTGAFLSSQKERTVGDAPITSRANVVTNASKKKVAVIGAGAAGLISAKELRELGHDVVVFEQTGSIGGVWAYTEAVEDDLLGASGSRKKVHGSMYKNLRTNLPREVMGVSDFPFDDKFPGSIDSRQYCSHEEVYRYLDAYARHFDIMKHVRCSSRVTSLERLGSRWKLHVVDETTEGAEEVCCADAVVVCNGHYSEPRIPEYEGQDLFQGLQMHSHNYRTPGPFVGKRVVVVGAAFSGSDISQELLEHGAHAVYLSGRNWEDLAVGKQLENSREVIRVPDIKCLEKSSVAFIDGTWVENVDVVMYATGYKYHFPFAQNVDGVPIVDDNRLCALYKHVFPPLLAPYLSFVGIPWKVVPFPQFQLQARWIGSCLNGSCKLPSSEEMLQEIEQWYQELDQQGINKRYTHRMDPDSQGEYNNWMALQAGTGDVGWPEWRHVLYIVSGMNRRNNGIRFREYSLSDIGAEEALAEFHNDAERIRKSWTIHASKTI